MIPPVVDVVKWGGAFAAIGAVIVGVASYLPNPLPDCALAQNPAEQCQFILRQMTEEYLTYAALGGFGGGLLGLAILKRKIGWGD